ncbi:MAG: phosphoribosylformylglycinamidine cyclo-ligase [Candidatus ainarchaeum sp.]|nr:phosphoribosylformylglycinamidine cyclo-ligase [Candidatus ainarchaeum sp.]
MDKPLDYASSGVDREGREKAKAVLSSIRNTYSLSRFGAVVETPFNILYPVLPSGKLYHVKTADGVGTKVLLAEMAGRHDTIGIDAVAMVANDCIRCGADPIALTDVIDVKKSTPGLLRELQKGLVSGAMEAGCPLVGGETADLPEIMSVPYHINADCVGSVERAKIIDGSKIRPGDAVIGLRSSGIHSNGLSLARRALFRKWGGKYSGDEVVESTGRSILLEALTPTKIYARQFAKLRDEAEILGAVHVTGDAYLKFGRLCRHGFRFNNFKPQEIFGLIRKAGSVSMEEMYKTFNMGWGFAVVVRKGDVERALQSLGSGAEVIGEVTKQGITVESDGKGVVLR